MLDTTGFSLVVLQLPSYVDADLVLVGNEVRREPVVDVVAKKLNTSEAGGVWGAAISEKVEPPPG